MFYSNPIADLIRVKGVIHANPANIGSKESECEHVNILKPLNILQNQRLQEESAVLINLLLIGLLDKVARVEDLNCQ